MAPRRPRSLSGEEALLWAEIAKLVKPLRGRMKPPKAESQPMPVSELSPSFITVPSKPPKTVELVRPKRRAQKLGDLDSVPSRPAAPVPIKRVPVPTAPGLERRERRSLHRGSLAIEARIDLHGLYQTEAHAALVAFLKRARADGATRVLVVTGKGSEEPGLFSERGVLRRSVPHWLRGVELRPIVLGFEEAARHHGGGGALYVRLRRR